MTPDRVTPSELLPAIRRARIDSLNIYEVSESELALLERGSPDSLFLNFAVFLLSSALSLLVALVTTTIASARTFTVFVVFTATGFVGGLFLLLLWLRNRQSTAAVFAQIRRRMPPEGVLASGQTIIEVSPSDAATRRE